MPNSVFIAIDIQSDYFPGGTMTLENVEIAARQGKKALDQARVLQIPIIIVQHISLAPSATFFRPDTPGVRVHPWFAPQGSDLRLIKHFPNAFRETELTQHLAAIHAEHLIVCGMMTHLCIDSTVRAAADQGYAVTLLGDATATHALSYGNRVAPALAVQTSSLATLHNTFADVVTVTEWMDGH